MFDMSWQHRQHVELVLVWCRLLHGAAAVLYVVYD
jgi:hypothetical protein